MSAASSPTRARAVLALVTACWCWGLSFPLTKAVVARAELLAPGIDSWFVSGLLTAARFFVAALVVAAVQPLWPRRGELEQGLWLGVASAVGLVLQVDGLAYTEASTSAFLTQGYVVLLPVAGALASRRAPPATVVVCAALVLLGLGVLSRFEPASFGLGRGEGETLAAAVCFTFQILALDHRRYAGNRTAPVTVVMFAVIALATAPVAFVMGRGASDAAAVLGSAPSLALFAGLVLPCTLAAFVLMNRYQRAVPASEAGIIYALEPVFASLFALVLPGWLSRHAGVSYADEIMSPRLLIGGGLVVIATAALAVFSSGGQGAPSSTSA